MAAPRVVFTIDSLKLGGAERVLLRWAGWCREEGWQVLVITRQGPQRDAYPVPEGVERWVEPRLSAPLERLGWFAFPWRLLALRQMLRRHRSDVVVGVTTLPAVKLLLASTGLPLRTVVSERNYPPAKPPSLPWRWLRRFTYPRADLHLVQTVPAGVWLRDHCAVTRQRLLPNPVSWPLPDREPVVSPDDWLAADHPLILAAGTKAHQKGFDRLMPVFAELGRRVPNLHLALLGLAPGRYHGRDQQRELKALLASVPELLQRLHFPGRVGNVADWYDRCQLFVLSSRYEGFPNVLLEAMAAGCCCVANDCPQGPADLISNGVNGLLMPVDSADQDWVQQLESLLLRPDLRRSLALKALEVREQYAPDALSRRLLQALEQVVEAAAH